MFDYNLLTPYPLTDRQVEMYAAHLLKTKPFVSHELLTRIIDGMVVGELPFDPRLGLINIYNAYWAFMKKLPAEEAMAVLAEAEKMGINEKAAFWKKMRGV